MSASMRSERTKAVAAVVVAGLAVVAVTVGILLTRGWNTAPGDPVAAQSSAPEPAASTTTPPAPAPASAPATPTTAGPTPAEAEPELPVATDEPVIDTDGEVPVTVTVYGWEADGQRVRVSGFAAGVVESGGTCTLALSRDGRTVTVERAATPDASTTACGLLSVPGSELAPGTWRAVLSYESPTSAGVATPVEIEVAE